MTQTLRIPLLTDPLAANPDLLGREIRRHLDEAGIRGKRCAVGLPASWVSTVATQLPEVAESDLAGFLEIEAERGFLFAQESLSIRDTRIRCANGERHATLVAVSRNHLQQLERILKAAKLKPLSFTPDITAQQSPEFETSGGILVLAPRHDAVELQITCGGGVSVLRSLDVVTQGEGESGRVDVARLRREIRITLGQLPAAQRALVRKARIIGGDDISRQLVRDLADTFDSLELSREHAATVADTPLKGLLPPDQPCVSGLVVAVNRLRGQPACMEFLPPKTSAWRHASESIYSKKLAWTGVALASVVLIGGGLLAYQQWELSRLENQWLAMRPAVEELGGVRSEIKQFRSWFDPSFRSLRILRGLTRAFPETGVVTAKAIEIRDLTAVTCSGEAGHRQAILDMMDQLSAAGEVHRLKVDQIRGQDPMQFTINYQWDMGGAGE